MNHNKTNKCEGCEPKGFGEIKPHRWGVCHQQLEKVDNEVDNISEKELKKHTDGICQACRPEPKEECPNAEEHRNPAFPDTCSLCPHPEPSRDVKQEVEKICEAIRQNHNSWGFKIDKMLAGQGSIGVYNEDKKIITESLDKLLLSERTALVEEWIKEIEQMDTWEEYDWRFKDELLKHFQAKKK